MTRDDFQDKVNKKHYVRTAFCMNIALCDDNNAFMKELLRAIEQHCAWKDWPCRHACFQSAKDILGVDLSSTHVVFLDIDMPDLKHRSGAPPAQKIP